MYSLIDPQPRPRHAWQIALTGAAAATLLAVLLVGPPWALSMFLGWPLPDRVPAVEEVLALLTRPPETAVVIDVLACVCWVAWAAFVLDVVLAAAHAIGDAAALLRYRRHPDRAAAARAAAVGTREWRPGAVLVGIVLVALLAGTRPGTGPPGAGTRPGTGPPAAPTPATQSQPLNTATAHTAPSLLDLRQAPAEPGDGADDGPAQQWVQVRPPSEGVHDSLWRIADRELGDPTRWPELFDGNAGRPQTDGRTLSRPDLIQPGWTLALPTTDSPPHPGPGPDVDPQEGTAPDATGTGAVDPVRPDPAWPGDEQPDAAQPTGEPGTGAPGMDATGADTGSEGSTGGGWVEVGPGVAIGAGFAAAVAAAMALSRHGRRRPRDGHRKRRDAAGQESFPVLPVVREIASRVPAPYPADDHPDDDGSSGTGGAGDPNPGQVRVGPTPATRTPDVGERDRYRPSQARGGNPASADASAPNEVGIAATPTGLPQEGPWASLLAVARAGNGLGLAGPGALFAIRALLLELLLCRGPDVRIVVAGDLPARLGIDAATLTDLDVMCVEDLPAALVAVADLDSRAKDSSVPTVEAPRTTTVILAPVPDPSTEPSAVSVVGSSGLVSVLHGPWPAGVTAYARSDGTIVAAEPAAHGDLVGRRLPILDVITATEMLDLAADVEGIAGTDTDDVATADDLIEAAGSGSDEPTRSGEENGHTLAPGSESNDNAGQQGRRWTLQILGRPTLTCSGGSAGPCRAEVEDVTGVLSPRMLELLVYLALHPAGVRRDAAVAALWPDTGRGRPGNNLSSLISRLRAAIRATDNDDADSAQGATDDAARVVIADGDRYQLDPDHIAVDYWTFLAALATAAPGVAAASPAGQPDELDRARLVALHTAHDLYRGPIGEGVDSEWILTVREAARRSFLTTTARLVRHHVADDPTTAQQLLETARNLEPTNEKLHRDIIALQLRVGDNEGAAATMRLLESQLADIEEAPDGTTRALARHIDDTDHGDRRGAASPVIPVPGRRQYRRDDSPVVPGPHRNTR